MPNIIIAVFTWLGSKIGFTVLKKGLLISIYLVSWSLLIAFVTFVINVMLKINQYISYLFDVFSNMSDGILSYIAGGLRCIGFYSSLNSVLPVLLLSISSYVIISSFNLIMILRKTLERYITNLLNSI